MKKKIIAIVTVLAVIALVFFAYSCCGVSAAETSQLNFNFEEVYCDSASDLTIFHETTTDTLFIEYDGYNAGGLTQMMDPETGLPLTYTVWQEKYAS